MRKLLYIFLLFLPALAYSQEQTQPDSVLQQGVEELSAASSTVSDSLRAVQELTELPNLSTAVDTLALKHKIDSLRQWQSSLDTLQLRQSLDSLRQLQQKGKVVQHKVDSVQNLLDVSAQANRQIAELNQTLNQPLTQSRQLLQGKIHKATRPEGLNQEAVSEFSEHSGLAINTTLPEVEGVSLPGMEGGGIPGMDVPQMDIPRMDIPQADLPGTGLPGPELPGMEGLEGIREGMGKVDALGDEVGAYADDLDRISEGKLNEIESADKIAEQQLLQSEGGQAFQQQSGMSQTGMGELQQMSGRDYLQEQGKEQVYEAAIDHFAGHQQELMAAQKEMAKYKGRFEQVQSVKEMPKNVLLLNPLKDKPWQERVIIGSLWQFGRQEQYLIDLGPTLAWRFTDRLSAGAGGQYRLSISKEHSPWVNSSDRVLGYFMYADFKFKKGFFARLTFENLQTAVPRFNASRQVESTEQRWVMGLSPGIGKSYSVYKKLRGFTLLQFNFLHRYHETPYAQPVQAKIGFYLFGKDLQRKKKEKEEEQPSS
jgi:hypothetical protein